MLWVEHIHLCGRKKEHSVWSIQQFPPPSSVLSIVYQYDGYLSLRGCGNMSGLSGFANHQSSLGLGAGCQLWKLQDV